MQQEPVISVGIDIGTSTFQCIFSSMVLKNLSPVFAVPKISLEDKQVLFRAPVRLTPFKIIDHIETIDGDLIADFVREDYRSAGIDPAQIQCGAVIITGETARKQNAREVVQALAGLAGEFVIATAGPQLESILAGKGSGAAALSAQRGKPVLNLDIGGGTSNMCLFSKGEAVQTGCLDIGGRLLRFHEDGTVHSFTDKLALIANDVGLTLTPGAPLGQEDKLRIASRMTQVLEEAVNLRPRTALYDSLVLVHGFPKEMQTELFTFSGGVADCIYGSAPKALAFHDLGEVLGKCIASSLFFSQGMVLKPLETQNATVIGAGAYSVSITGSTIALENISFPIKGLQVGKVTLNTAEDIEKLSDQIASQFDLFDAPFALGFEGIKNPSYFQIEGIADAIVMGFGVHTPRIIIMYHDMAKALGQSLMRRWGQDSSMICLDGISLTYGDSVDLGAPLAGGRVLPVIVKTLAFGN